MKRVTSAMLLLTYRKALEEIKNEQGKVCMDFELCTHEACTSSYTAWAIADKALRSSLSLSEGGEL